MRVEDSSLCPETSTLKNAVQEFHLCFLQISALICGIRSCKDKMAFTCRKLTSESICEWFELISASPPQLWSSCRKRGCLQAGRKIQRCSEYVSSATPDFTAGRSLSNPARPPDPSHCFHDGQAPCERYHALYRKSDLCIPRNETARPRSQFLHSFTVSASDLYIPRISLPIWLQQNRQTIRLEISKSLTDDCGNWETEHYNSVLEITRPTVLFFGIHKSEPDIYIGFSPALHLQCGIR